MRKKRPPADRAARKKEMDRQWYLDNKEKIRGRYWKNRDHERLMNLDRWRRLKAAGMDSASKMRLAVIWAYGGECVTCGENELILLDLDHIHNDGNVRRKQFKSPYQEWRWLMDHDWPPDIVQVLCVVCHRRKTYANRPGQ